MNKLKSIISYTLIALLVPFGASSQLNIVDQKALGGDGNSQFGSQNLEKSHDGGFYAAFITDSNPTSGNLNVTGYGNQYIVLTKFSENYTVEWQKSYGGLQYESIIKIVEVNDGVLLVASTLSGISGNKTVPNYGATDGWMIKLDFNGDIIWQKEFGGSEIDNIETIHETNDNNILMGFSSYSPQSGNRTVPLKGIGDFWVIKTDSDGETIWKNSYGSDGEDRIRDIHEFSDGTILLSGEVIDGTISHDKTEAQYSFIDTWILAIDENGNPLWDLTIGGSGFESGGFTTVISDTIYMLTTSTSNQSGLRDTPLMGSQDLWLTKIDVNGSIISNYFFGGNIYERAASIQTTDDEKLMLITYSDSDSSFNKSEDSRGGLDYWILFVDTNGEVIIDKTIGGNESDASSSVIQLNNRLIVGGVSRSEVSGDKTIPRFNTDPINSDVWLVELDASTLNVLQTLDVQPAIYPNPVSDLLTIDLSSYQNVHSITIHNPLGKLVFKEIFNSTNDHQSLQVDMSNYSSGVYTVQVIGDNVSKAVKVVR